MSRLIRYCPGSAPGSPASMSKSDADEYMVQDSRYVEVMSNLGALNTPVVFPHTGACSKGCRYYREVSPIR